VWGRCGVSGRVVCGSETRPLGKPGTIPASLLSFCCLLFGDEMASAPGMIDSRSVDCCVFMIPAPRTRDESG
jgi:hypothetical protein